MNDPMTIFDWGIYSLNKALDYRFEDTDKYVRPDVYYDWDANRIIITLLDVSTLTETRTFTQKEAIEWSREIVAKVRGHLLVNPISGNGIWNCEYKDEATGTKVRKKCSSLVNIFTHEGGFNRLKRPDNIGISLDQITEIRTSQFLADGRVLECKAPLVSNQLFCSEPQGVK